MGSKIEQKDAGGKEQGNENGRGTSQERSRATGTEYRRGRAATECRTCISTLAMLNEDEADDTNSQNHVNY